MMLAAHRALIAAAMLVLTQVVCFADCVCTCKDSKVVNAAVVFEHGSAAYARLPSFRTSAAVKALSML